MAFVAPAAWRSSLLGGRVPTSRATSTAPPVASPVVKAVLSPDKPKKLSKVEGLKTESKGLRYPIPEELAADTTSISEAAIQIMKFHGSYQQDDRELRKRGAEKAYQFMLRLKMPAGEFPAAMYRELDDLSTELGNTTLRATTRCTFQMHGILKKNLKSVFSRILNAGGSTIGACGDLSRNVMCTPAPIDAPEYVAARHLSRMLAELFAPQTGAFSEIWLDGEKAASLEYWKKDLDMGAVGQLMREDANDTHLTFPGHEEPIYGDQYLPRKFKIGVTVAGDNSIDIYTQDIGVVVVMNADNTEVEGYNLTVGGGMGRTHKKETTFARTGDHLGYVPAADIYTACKAIIAAQRDHGNREVRANARMKYLVDKMGIDAFRTLVEGYYGKSFEEYRQLPAWEFKDWLGWYDQGNGKAFLGLFIENGRIKDEGTFRLKTALRKIVDDFGYDFVVTPNQNVLIRDVPNERKADLDSLLTEHGITLPADVNINHRLAMACPALPLCGLAVTEAERHMPTVIDRVNSVLAEADLADMPVVMRMTGCPNGCARPYMAELGFVGSGPTGVPAVVGRMSGPDAVGLSV
eukprot:TRINITY_DN2191_c0_g1_i4.p1 TRINITY_DN2191_c0_g1~~TRINITY_DN2191_c0_g1_i4.p1  ORF type:complete len:578 (-),score=188.82 TRINITY_DN2191_c0_g1_i4:280-2013(-)